MTEAEVPAAVALSLVDRGFNRIIALRDNADTAHLLQKGDPAGQPADCCYRYARNQRTTHSLTSVCLRERSLSDASAKLRHQRHYSSLARC